MTSAYERGTQAPMDITELGPRKPSVFDAPVSDLSMASPDASLMDIDPDVPSMPPPTLAPLPLVSPQMEAPRPSEVPPPLDVAPVPRSKPAPRDQVTRSEAPRPALSLGTLPRPETLLTYAQVVFNLSILVVFLYLLLNIVLTIQHDVSQKVREYELDYLGEISSCEARYTSNRCGSDMQAPALSEACEAWRRCASRDPTVVGRARVTAETFAEILNGFVDVVSWKTMLFSLLTLSIVVGATNSTLSFFRVQTAARHDTMPPPPPPHHAYMRRRIPYTVAEDDDH
jgi:hypothetical protein